MNQKYAISLVFLVLIGLLVVFQLMITDTPVDSTTTQTQQQNQPGNPSSCESFCIGSEACLTECYQGITNTAILETNSEICNEIADVAARNNCKNSVQLTDALAASALESCNSLEGGEKIYCQDNFYINQAKAQKDSSFCNKVINEFSQETCRKSAQ